MTRQDVNYAERTACTYLDKWLEVTGAIDLNCGWHSELESIVTDAVHIGIQMALNGRVNKNNEGELIKIT